MGYTDIDVIRGFEWVLKLDSNGNPLWQKRYDTGGTEWGMTLEQTSDGGYIIASYKPNGSMDVVVLKLNGNGDILWSNTYAGNEWDEVDSIKETIDGGYILAGKTSSFGAGSSDILILKLDVYGNIGWQKTYGTGGVEDAWAIQLTDDGGYVVVCHTGSMGAGGYDFWILKLDATGNIQWQKTYGGSEDDYGRSIQQTGDGGYIVGGYTKSFGAGNWDVLLLKPDSAGNVTWQRTIGGINIDYYTTNTGTSILQQMADNGYILIATTSSFGIGGYDIFVTKLNNAEEIPDCDIIGTSNVVITDTAISGQNSSFVAQSETAIVINKSVTPVDSSGNVTPICEWIQIDFDNDGIYDGDDNCPDTSNPNQLDSFPPQGNGIGDAYDCEGNFDCDNDCDGTDASTFKLYFGRSPFGYPCNELNPCNGDFDCDNDCDGTDAAKFKEDFGRSGFNNPCPSCGVGEWCVYQ